MQKSYLLAAAVSGIFACRSPDRPPSAPVDPAPGASTNAMPRVIGAPRNPPGTAHPPMRASWEEMQHDPDCKDDVKSGLPCPGAALEKNCCAGKNDCKGTSGCRSAKNACSGQNDCKGNGTSCPPTAP
jgi:hypothetical protein